MKIYVFLINPTKKTDWRQCIVFLYGRKALVNFRRYGHPPFALAVLHGGPGAPGSVAPVARKLAVSGRGVLEPLQSALSVNGQIEELREFLEENADLPITLIGHSWGAMLGLLFAARYAERVKKLILVGCGPLEARYAEGIMAARMSRLSENEQDEIQSLVTQLHELAAADKNRLLARFGELLGKADCYDPRIEENEPLEVQHDVHQHVWNEAALLRANGYFLEQGKFIQCPVVAIHGDYDPHPAEGVYEPLSRILNDFKYIQIKNCGHYPWRERQAREEFFRILRELIILDSENVI